VIDDYGDCFARDWGMNVWRLWFSSVETRFPSLELGGRYLEYPGIRRGMEGILVILGTKQLASTSFVSVRCAPNLPNVKVINLLHGQKVPAFR
jgi:hypothetical protein